MKKMLVGIGVVIAAGIVWLIMSSLAGSAALAGDGVVYKSSSCGCCGVWTGYVDKAGLDVRVIDMPDISAEKDALGVPPELRSCHTMVIDDYFVEGHIPAEAIERMLAERPDIKGIAMPGMPSGSPGMPGAKTGPFVIYAVHHDGSYTEFMRI